MAASSYVLLAAFVALVASQAKASDPGPLQDFCVADMHSNASSLILPSTLPSRKMDRLCGQREMSVGSPREKDFRLPLSDLGNPDEFFVDQRWCYFEARYDYNCERHPEEFVKWIVQAGEGCEPSRHLSTFEEIKPHEAQVHFTGKMLDDTEFVSTKGNHAPMTFKLIQDDVMKGFSLAVSSMKPGEKAVFAIPQEYALSNSGCPASIPRDIPPDQTLRFDIELICFITDIHKDQGILKKTIKYGTSDGYPRQLDEVFVKYNVFLEDGTSVSSSAGVEFVVADGFFCAAFADVVKTMRNGEEAVVLINPKYGFGERGRPSVGDAAAVPPDSTLHVKLQLMSWIEVSYIGETRDILKKRLHKELSGDCPRNQAVVKVRLIGQLQDGTVFDRRGQNGEEPFEFTIDEEHVIYGIDEAVMTMREGEIATFIIPPQHAFGDVGSNQFKLAIVPPDSVVIYEIELLSVVNDEPLTFMTYEDDIEEATSKIVEGDNLFEMGKFLRAYRRYFRARQLLWMTLGKGGSIKEMQILVALKCAECAIKLQRYKQAYDRYREVLEYDPNNEKALKMVAKPVPKGTIGIDEDAMHRGLEDQTRRSHNALRTSARIRPSGLITIPPRVQYLVSDWSGKGERRNPSRNPSERPIHVPPVASSQANASQSVSTASAAAAGQNQGTPSTTAVGSYSSTSLSQNQQPGAASKKPRTEIVATFAKLKSLFK